MALRLSTPLYPDQLSVRSFYRPPLLEIWPQQGSMVKSLQIRGLQPLCSTCWLLGFMISGKMAASRVLKDL
jgi:hypothetical protein